MQCIFQDHGIQSNRWNFLATSLGKGAVDGIGGDGKEGSLETHSVGEKSHHHSKAVFSTRQTALSKYSGWIHCQEWDWSTIRIPGCQMERGDGSPPNTQTSRYSIVWCRWGQSSRYFQRDGKIFPSLSNQQHLCHFSDHFHNWTGFSNRRWCQTKATNTELDDWRVGYRKLRRWRVSRGSDMYRGFWCRSKRHA